MKRIRIVVAGVALATTIAIAVPAGAITWGQPDGDGHPHVVNLLFAQNGVGYYSCSGTLLSPTLVLTAGHCTGWLDAAGNLQPNDGKTYVTNVPDIWELYDATRADYPTLAEWLDGEWVAGEAHPHPDYAEYAEFPLTYDIGVVVLDEPITVGEYGELPLLGQFDYLAKKKMSPSERAVEVVGYGLVGRIPPFADDSIWERRVGYSTILNTGESANVGPQNWMYSNSPGLGTGVGGTCSGDSGGPAFWVEAGVPTNLVVGVNSYGIAPLCNGNDYQFRTDTAVALDFLATYLDD
jgi:hypothetical protein